MWCRLDFMGGCMFRYILKLLVLFVVLFYDEVEVIDVFFVIIVLILEVIGIVCFEIVCVNDGSCDGMLDKLIDIVVVDLCVCIVDFMWCFGKEVVLIVGIDEVVGVVVILIDVDL